MLHFFYLFAIGRYKKKTKGREIIKNNPSPLKKNIHEYFSF